VSALRRPAPDPCGSCPYRRDVEPGIWAESEYLKLLPYDNHTGEQPPGMFQCHQNDPGDTAARVCAGWAGTHRHNPRGRELLALRLAEAFGTMTPRDVNATMTYRPGRAQLFASAAEAAEHGISGIEDPSPAARAVMGKIMARRSGITAASRDG
jgi:hypothetical protein